MKANHGNYSKNASMYNSFSKCTGWFWSVLKEEKKLAQIFNDSKKKDSWNIGLIIQAVYVVLFIRVNHSFFFAAINCRSFHIYLHCYCFRYVITRQFFSLQYIIQRFLSKYFERYCQIHRRIRIKLSNPITNLLKNTERYR